MFSGAYNFLQIPSSNSTEPLFLFPSLSSVLFPHRKKIIRKLENWELQTFQFVVGNKILFESFSTFIREKTTKGAHTRWDRAYRTLRTCQTNLRKTASLVRLLCNCQQAYALPIIVDWLHWIKTRANDRNQLFKTEDTNVIRDNSFLQQVRRNCFGNATMRSMWHFNVIETNWRNCILWSNFEITTSLAISRYRYSLKFKQINNIQQCSFPQWLREFQLLDDYDEGRGKKKCAVGSSSTPVCLGHYV